MLDRNHTHGRAARSESYVWRGYSVRVTQWEEASTGIALVEGSLERYHAHRREPWQASRSREEELGRRNARMECLCRCRTLERLAQSESHERKVIAIDVAYEKGRTMASCEREGFIVDVSCAGGYCHIVVAIASPVASSPVIEEGEEKKKKRKKRRRKKQEKRR